MANPVVYLVNGLRWTFYGTSDVAIGLSLGLTLLFLALCVGGITWIFRTGWRLRT
jgi:ABC-2 type transport system permease protein